MAFAHEALLHDLLGRELHDPFRAIIGKCAVLRPLRAPASFADFVQSYLDTLNFNLTASSSCQSAFDCILARQTHNDAEATHVAGCFMESLSMLSRMETQQGVEMLCARPMIRAATERSFGFDSLKMVANFARLRPHYDPAIPSGTIWHAICATMEAPVNGRQQVAAAAFGGDICLKSLLTREDYRNVRLVTGGKNFTIN